MSSESLEPHNLTNSELELVTVFGTTQYSRVGSEVRKTIIQPPLTSITPGFLMHSVSPEQKKKKKKGELSSSMLNGCIAGIAQKVYMAFIKVAPDATNIHEIRLLILFYHTINLI